MAIEDHERKLAELVLYISQKCARDTFFGQVKLNKVLFFSDFTAFGKRGTSITNAEYQHQPEGPTVRRMLPVQSGLLSEGSLAIQPTDCFGFMQKRPVNLREPDLSLFSGQEIAIVDSWIERLRPLSGKEVSALSHTTAGWQMTKDSDTIDPRSVFIAWEEPSSYEVKVGYSLAEQFGLLA